MAGFNLVNFGPDARIIENKTHSKTHSKTLSMDRTKQSLVNSL